MFAHRRALQAFVNTTAERFFVFEDDVTLPDAPLAWSRAATSEFVAAAKGKDLGYLGHCFDGLCTHALLWSRAGAQKALSRVRWCTSQPVDEQLRQLCWDKQLECTLAPNARVEGAPGRLCLLACVQSFLVCNNHRPAEACVTPRHYPACVPQAVCWLCVMVSQLDRKLLTHSEQESLQHPHLALPHIPTNFH